MNTQETVDYAEARELISKYVNDRRWDTLAGRSWNMQDADSREQFIDFLSHHLVKVVNGDTSRL